MDLPAEWENFSLTEEDRKWEGKLTPGGSYRPSNCQPSTRVAILIPYRDRESHMATFLKFMHPLLQSQNIEYVILAINQTGEAPFMRGLLFNAGVLESSSVLPFTPDCFILHDVDHIPEKQGLLYRCSDQGVFHLAQAVDRFDYNLFMYEYTGGVSAMKREQYEAINGFSNLYMGWGCEDEDLYVRIVTRGLSLVRVAVEVSRYRTLPHIPNYPNWFWDQQISGLDRARFPNLKDIVDPDGANTDRYDYNKYLQEGAPTRIRSDGLNVAQDLYTLEGVTKFHGFTSIQIKPHHEQIHKIGLEFIMQLEEKIEKDKEL